MRRDLSRELVYRMKILTSRGLASWGAPCPPRPPSTVPSHFQLESSHMRITRFLPVVAIALTAAAASAQAPKHHKKVETQAELQKEAKMSMADARALALKTVPGSTIQTGEIEREGGKLIYSFDMKVPGKSGIDEVNIDAMTGQLVSNKHETPKDARAEARADAKAAKAAAKTAKAAAKTKP